MTKLDRIVERGLEKALMKLLLKKGMLFAVRVQLEAFEPGKITMSFHLTSVPGAIS